MLALLWLVPCKAEPHSSPTGKLVDRTAAERPQWSEMGMCDLLAAPGAASLTPPSTVRIVSHSPSAAAPFGGIHQRIYATAAVLLLPRPNRTLRGYIYLLRCLRLWLFHLHSMMFKGMWALTFPRCLFIWTARFFCVPSSLSKHHKMTQIQFIAPIAIEHSFLMANYSETVCD